MGVLPIVERELRVAVRQYRTWLWRVITAGVALVAFLLVYATVGRYSSMSRVGQEVFFTLSILGFFYSLLAGPLSTVDCLAREKREGTLGLLFLTNLRGYDVVLGKITVASLSLAVGGAAALPLFAAPVLLGGVNLEQFGAVVLALLNILFLSLAIGACASSCFESSRAALGVTLIALLFLTLGIIFLAEEVFGVRINSGAAPYYYICCPAYTMQRCLTWRTSTAWEYWLNMGGMHFLAWLCLAWACRRTRNWWRVGSATSARPGGLRRFLKRVQKGSARSRAAWREHMLPRNPVAWLEGRDRLQSVLLWTLCLGSAGFLAAKHLDSPKRWPDNDLLFFWPLWAHYILCLWIAVQSPRRLADDKQSGALELLLCTPLRAGEIVRGGMMAMRQRFGRTMLTLLLIDAFLAFAYYNARDWTNVSPNMTEMFKFGFWAAVVFAVQGYSFARVGLYQGLAQGNSLRATFMLIWKLGLLPYGILLLVVIGYDSIRRQFRFLPGVNEDLAISFWVGSHLVPCLFFLVHANWHLHHSFRALAARTRSRGRWRTWFGATARMRAVREGR